MVVITSETDGAAFDCAPDETVLQAARRAGLHIASACNGRARCSTCRLRVLDGDAAAGAETEAETALKARLRLGADIRLACQFRPESPISVRRLVRDDASHALATQLGRDGAGPGSELREVSVMNFDVAGFTGLTERLPPHDVLYLLNYFMTRAETVLAAHGGYFEKAVGDGFMALFGARGEPDAPLSAVAAALEIVDEIKRARHFMRAHYGVEFDARIGLEHGEALIGALGPAGMARVTALGEVANLAARVQEANKVAGTRLLVGETLFARVAGQVEAGDFVRLRLRGASGLRTLRAVTGLTPEGRARIEAARRPEAPGGRTWARLLDAADLPEGAVRIASLPDRDIALTRRGGRPIAFNNACPHLRFPLFGEAQAPDLPADSAIDDETLVLTCRWHGAAFDLLGGEVVAWCPLLSPEGRDLHWPILGDVSKNRARMTPIPCRERDG
ncbi:MAG: adenylate/guanylate cyclase domain-containing protein, partial [Pseudomonadota bacterium]|nr:adenylate/guanylate cyclase domain-containing protein [Pseudomonadota bacterium]